MYLTIPTNDSKESNDTNKKRLVKRLILKIPLIIRMGLKPISRSEYPKTYS
jgi:hypothetical protein